MSSLVLRSFFIFFFFSFQWINIQIKVHYESLSVIMHHHQIWSIVIHHPPSSIIVQHQPSTRTIMIIWHNHLSASIIIRITQESPIASIITEHHPSWSSILHPQHHRYRPFCLHHTFTLVNKSKDAQTSLFITWAERAFAFSSLLCNPFACSAGR